MKQLNIQTIKKYKIHIIALILLAVGYIMGGRIGFYAIEQAVFSNSAAVMLLYKPAYKFINTYRYVNADDSMKRLEGYYSLLENNMIDTSFLFERYEEEDQQVNKRTIIWLLGYSEEHSEVSQFFSNHYRSAANRLRKEMLRSLQRMGDDVFKDFVNRENIRGDFLEGL